MACERDRVVALKDYLSSLGVSVNIGINKARGHKGIFMHGFDVSRIDISKGLDCDEKILSVMLHEFAHYIHYFYDKSLSSLDFIFESVTDELKEELLKITVHDVPKNFAEALYSKKIQLNEELRILTKEIKSYHPEFKLSEKFIPVENSLAKPLYYLTRYDRVKYLNTIYETNNLNDYNLEDNQKLYIQIKSKQRALKRINSRINRINRYYNHPSELFARFIDSYYMNPEYTKKIAPNACKMILNTQIPFFSKLNNIFDV